MLEKLKEKPYLCPIFVGIVVMIVGIALRTPGGALTTYASLDGKKADSYYSFDNRYSAIDEYVGGDAYNYIIGASLVAGKTSGMIAAKTIGIVGGVLCMCAGATMMFSQKKDAVMEVKEQEVMEESVLNMTEK